MWKLCAVLMCIVSLPLLACSSAPSIFVESERILNWKEATDFCKQKGGRLPLISGMEKWDGLNPPAESVFIEGIGKYGDPWPSDLTTCYATGTEQAGAVIAGLYPWFAASANGGKISVHKMCSNVRAVCVR